MPPSLTVTNLERVSELLESVVAEHVLPAYRNLQPDDIEHKPSVDDPEDVVSRVDRSVEAWLGPELARLLPGSAVVGEEAAHADPQLLAALDADGAVWVIDPIDGTRNFVRGEPGFGVMVALVTKRRTRAAWIALPTEGLLFVAERGSGTWLQGARVRIPERELRACPRGTTYTKFMPEALGAALAAHAGRDFEPAPGAGSAAIEYTDLMRGRKDFVVYHRLMPWDHLPGALLVAEAGGSVTLVNGDELTPFDRFGPLVAARDGALGQQIRSWLPAST
jgi:fructose-1,6-bisphosphatase/inositol monophosphatase family enzyme